MRYWFVLGFALVLSACADGGMYQAPVVEGYHKKRYAEPKPPMPTPPVMSEDVAADELPPLKLTKPKTTTAPKVQQIDIIEPVSTPARPHIVAAKPVEESLVTVTKKETVTTYTEHKVKAGEYIYSLARSYKVSPQDIIAANNLKAPYQTAPGQVLRIPQSKEVVATTPAETKPAVSQEPVYHVVQKNETLYRIGLKYSVSPLDIMAANNIEKPEALVSGSKLRIPVAGQVEPEAEEFKPYIDARASRQKGYVWPVKGKIISSFGQQQTGIYNSGIAISIPENTPVLSIDDAQVIYADEGLKHYGKMVLLRHEKGMVSAYGHNNKLFVKKGDRVKKGQVIALSGDSGIATEPQLHLEIRKNAKAVNPTTLLPKI